MSNLCELLGVTESSKKSLPERIADLKSAVSALLDSSKIHFAKANGDVEDIQIVHTKTNGHLVHTMDLTKVEELEVKFLLVFFGAHSQKHDPFLPPRACLNSPKVQSNLT